RLARTNPGLAASTGVFLAALCAFVAIGAALPVLPAYVRGPLRSSDLAVGIVVGAFAVTSVVCRPLAGRVADRRGRRVVLVTGALAMAIGGALYLVSHSVLTLVLARLVLGAGEGAVYTAGGAWWGGLALGPVAGELLRAGVGDQAVWLLTAALPLAAAAIASRLPEPTRAFAERPAGAFVMFPAAARRPGLARARANIGYAALAGFVVLHLRARGIGGGAAVFTVFAVAVFGSRLLLSRVPDRAGARPTAVAAGLLEALGLALIALAHSLPFALAGAVVVGVGFS